MSQSKDTYVGRLMRPLGQPESVYVVTGVGYDVTSHRDSLHLRRIKPLPPSQVRPMAPSDLEECSLDDIASPRDGLSQIVARTSSKAFGVWTAFDSRTEFKEYQFRPLLKYLKSPERRILVADEVGLGKTVEAAYIIAEELAGGHTQRVLILCPAGLRLKWRDELWRRFGLYFQITNATGLKQLLSTEGGFLAIVSYDSNWDEESAEQSEEHPVDLTVIDEVHNLIGRGGETRRRKMAFHLSALSKACVALSATPITLEMDDLRRVLEVTFGRRINHTTFDQDASTARFINKTTTELLSGSRLDDSELARIQSLSEELADMQTLELLREYRTTASDEAKASLAQHLARLNPFEGLMTRTRKKDVGESRARLVSNHSIVLDEITRTKQPEQSTFQVSERSLYGEIDELLGTHFSHVHRLQLSSCLPAIVQLLRDGMKGFDIWRRDNDVEGPLSVLDRDDSEGFVVVEGSLPKAVRRRCGELVDRFGLLRVDSKLNVLRSILGSLSDPRTDGKPHKAIVFTQWKHTWAYLTRRIENQQGIRIFALSGDDGERKVEETLETFHDWQGPAVLVSTDFLSEGLDLQCADILVNYDFPYNPQRVEQRIGRIDRVGQSAHEIAIHNLVVTGSLDEKTLEVLRRRLDIFGEGLGDSPAVLRSNQSGVTEAEAKNIEEKRSAVIRELEEAQPFAGVEHFLDEQTRSLRSSRTGDMARLSWLLFVRMLTVFSGGRAKVLEESEKHLSIGPITNQDIRTIAEVVGIGWAERVNSELLSHRDGRLSLRVAKTTDADGLFLAPLNPLVRLARVVTANSFPENKIGGLPLSFSSDALSVARATICMYLYNGRRRTDTSLTYWSESGNQVERLAGERLAGLIHSMETSVLKSAPVPTLSQRLRKEVEADFLKWFEERRSTQGGDWAGQRGPPDKLLEYIATISRRTAEGSVA